tara:strand:- start:907 stop:2796 length:1890 start_codon:yes stop_codon:yes gene_type:complete
MKILSFIKTIKNLGISNSFVVFFYRFQKFTGIYTLLLPIKKTPIPIFKSINSQDISRTLTENELSIKEKSLLKADQLIEGKCIWFSSKMYDITSPPKWFFNPLTNQNFNDKKTHWSKINLFKSGDIKGIWEMSRWNWVIIYTKAWKLTREEIYLNTMNEWIKDWCERNPVNSGPNWLCGQEVSIRLLHMIESWTLFDNFECSRNTIESRSKFILEHLKRINATLYYAKAQKNNHWISESSALYIGGILLKKYSKKYNKLGKFFYSKGKANLEESIDKLIMEDGSFSQYSLNYHRLVLDTLSLIEILRRNSNIEKLSSNFYNQAKKATDWFKYFVDENSGEGPNLGNNDGAYCYQLTNMKYEDYRPTLQLACNIFESKDFLTNGPWNESKFWWKIKTDEYKKISLKSKLFRNGGYGILRPSDQTWCLLKLPKYIFRPAQSDPLHLDLWINGRNLLRDSGTYSYNSIGNEFINLSSIKSHNSAQFDKKEPMDRISRFLWGDWLKEEKISELKNIKNITILNSSYKSKVGSHERIIKVYKNGRQWLIEDYLEDFKENVILRWRLYPTEWEFKSGQLKSKLATIIFTSIHRFDRFELLKGEESRLYWEKKIIPVVEIETTKCPTKITTLINIE